VQLAGFPDGGGSGDAISPGIAGIETDFAMMPWTSLRGLRDDLN
jgi:hypothetical protein